MSNPTPLGLTVRVISNYTASHANLESGSLGTNTKMQIKINNSKVSIFVSKEASKLSLPVVHPSTN